MTDDRRRRLAPLLLPHASLWVLLLASRSLSVLWVIRALFLLSLRCSLPSVLLINI